MPHFTSLLSNELADKIPAVIARWHVHANAHQAVRRWLAQVGGLAMGNVHSEMELIFAAETAPTDTTFGLAYGRFIDHQAHDLQAPKGPYILDKADVNSPLFIHYYNQIIDKGHELILQAEAKAPYFFENFTVGESMDSFNELHEQARTAPDDVTLGQLSAYLVKNMLRVDPMVSCHYLSRFMGGGAQQRPARA